MPRPTPRHPRSGFTLVELLVVIGIIALLISILLPALNKARKAAATVKCAAAMKEIGHCIQMYVNDNRGWMVPGKAGAAPSTAPGAYILAEVDDYSRVNPAMTGGAWWYMFLSKYITKNKGGVDGSAGSDNDKGFMNTIIWGCPEYRPHKNNQPTPGEISRVYTGYGFNDWPTFTSTNPALDVDTPPQISGHKATSIIGAANGDFQHPGSGTWFKFTQYTRAAERCMVSESDNYELFAAHVPTATGVIPAQRAWTYSNGSDSHNDIDCYRHGVLPPIDKTTSPNTYSNNGGRVGYNILYCDGHVAFSNDRSESYRSLRMRFPG